VRIAQGDNVRLRLYFQWLVRSKNETPHNLDVNSRWCLNRMRQTDLWRPEKPRSYLSQNCFELLVKHSRECSGPSWTLASAALFGVRPRTCRSSCLRSYAGNGLIASFVRTPRSLRRVVSRSVLPRERFSPLALFGHGEMSDLSSLSGVKRKSNFGAVRSVDDPTETSSLIVASTSTSKTPT
jgi:hypothetical protein